MFIVDDLLLSPIKGFLWLVGELHNAAQRDIDDERARVTRELQSLHMQLETERITEDEFDEREQALLDRLDALDAIGGGGDTNPDTPGDTGPLDNEPTHAGVTPDTQRNPKPNR